MIAILLCIGWLQMFSPELGCDPLSSSASTTAASSSKLGCDPLEEGVYGAVNSMMQVNTTVKSESQKLQEAARQNIKDDLKPLANSLAISIGNAELASEINQSLNKLIDAAGSDDAKARLTRLIHYSLNLGLTCGSVDDSKKSLNDWRIRKFVEVQQNRYRDREGEKCRCIRKSGCSALGLIGRTFCRRMYRPTTYLKDHDLLPPAMEVLKKLYVDKYPGTCIQRTYGGCTCVHFYDSATTNLYIKVADPYLLNLGKLSDLVPQVRDDCTGLLDIGPCVYGYCCGLIDTAPCVRKCCNYIGICCCCKPIGKVCNSCCKYLGVLDNTSRDHTSYHNREYMMGLSAVDYVQEINNQRNGIKTPLLNPPIQSKMIDVINAKADRMRDATNHAVGESARAATHVGGTVKTVTIAGGSAVISGIESEIKKRMSRSDTMKDSNNDIELVEAPAVSIKAAQAATMPANEGKPVPARLRRTQTSAPKQDIGDSDNSDKDHLV